MEWISLSGVILSLAVFIGVAYKGYNVLIVSVLATMTVCIFSGMNPITGLTGTYMGSFTGFARSWLLVYLFSAIFARMMGESGAANSIAVKVARLCKKWPKHQKLMAVLSLPLINAVITYGGVSSLVVVFIMVGIAKDLFKELDIPWHFYGVAALGSATFALGMLPGAPDVMNLAPMTYFGTTPMAAPGLGITATIIQIALSVVYVKVRLEKAVKEGQGFLPTGARINADESVGGKEVVEYHVLRCLAPCIVLLVVMNVLKQSAVVAMICANITCYALFYKKINLKVVSASGVPTGINTCCMICGTVAYGALISTTPAYQLVLVGLDKLSFLPAAFQIYIAVSIMSGLTSSGTGAITVTMDQLAERFLTTGMSGEAIHRLASSTALGLNTLPHNPGVVNAGSAAKLTHKEIYPHYFWITVIFPMIASFVLAIMITVGIVF